MSGARFPARFAREVGLVVRELDPQVGKSLRGALEQAEADPWSWPQADRYDLDGSVRVITVDRAIVHYAVLPEPPHLWVFAIALI
ncbi:hypothetical protein [Kitasatospora sp. NPDC058218]|uniref:hypothetical protein n=1 Tax=Kitasatospora sp. NPDC058218 TaxID=3346385 RepID=UPI0036D9B470